MQARNHNKMIKENKKLKKRVESLENEFEIVQWYIEVMEGGVDTKLLMKEYLELKKKHTAYQKTT